MLAYAAAVLDARRVRFPSRPSLVLLLLPFVFAGCASPEVIRRIPISGGKVALFSFGPKGAEPGRANGYEVKEAFLMPATDAKEVLYKFIVSTPPGASLKRIQIEDVSEEDGPAFPLIDDSAPVIKEGRYQISTPTIAAGDRHLQWVLTITTTMRVYHFTLTDTAGKTTEMLHVSAYPDFVKSAIRQKWGEKY